MIEIIPIIGPGLSALIRWTYQTFKDYVAKTRLQKQLINEINDIIKKIERLHLDLNKVNDKDFLREKFDIYILKCPIYDFDPKVLHSFQPHIISQLEECFTSIIKLRKRFQDYNSEFELLLNQIYECGLKFTNIKEIDFANLSAYRKLIPIRRKLTTEFDELKIEIQKNLIFLKKNDCTNQTIKNCLGRQV